MSTYLKDLAAQAKTHHAILSNPNAPADQRDEAERQLREISPLLEAGLEKTRQETRQRDAQADVVVHDQHIAEIDDTTPKLDGWLVDARREAEAASDQLANALLDAARTGAKVASPTADQMFHARRVQALEDALVKAKAARDAHVAKRDAAQYVASLAEDAIKAQLAYLAKIDHEDALRAYMPAWIEYRDSFARAFGVVPAAPTLPRFAE